MKLEHKQLADQLRRMVGKSYAYKTKIVKILAVQRTETQIILATDGEWITILHKDAMQELKKFAPVEITEVPTTQVSVIARNETLENIKATVLETMTRLKTDANYIPQAEALNNSIRTFIDLGKLELQAAQLMQSMRS